MCVKKTKNQLKLETFVVMILVRIEPNMCVWNAKMIRLFVHDWYSYDAHMQETTYSTKIKNYVYNRLIKTFYYITMFTFHLQNVGGNRYSLWFTS